MMRAPWICRECNSKRFLSRLIDITSNQKRFVTSKGRHFKISEEVQQALSENRPIVALETTIYTHGYPYPDNLSLASRLESLIRENGAVPAIIGILDGSAQVGFGDNDLKRLISSAGNAKTMKISRRDLGFALGLKDQAGNPFNGGTTIAGTMILAHMAGIKVFATGGLGGVHRGAETTMDVSADLTELGRTPVAVISSGCKAFLDLPKTLEYLETQGVAVATFADGRQGKVDFPAFWTRESGVPSPHILQNETEAARVLHAHFALGLQSGLHFANPIPQEHSLPREVMEATIFEAIEHANMAGAIGAAATPYILAMIKEITGSKSVEANRALIEANVVRGTKVATELRRIEDKDTNWDSAVARPVARNYTVDGVPKDVQALHTQSTPAITDYDSQPESNPERTPSIFVAGSLALDLSCDYAPLPGQATGPTSLKPALHTSNPAHITQALGGVGGNLARAAHLMGAGVHLCSAVGDDLGGKAALEALTAAGMSISGMKVLPECRTAQYVAVNDTSKDLVLAMADMSILESTSSGSNTITDSMENFWLPQLKSTQPTHLVLDANWPPEQLARWLEAGKSINTYTSFEPVSQAKSARLFRLPELSVFSHSSVHLATPNAYELAAMHTAAREAGFFERADWWKVIDGLGLPYSGARTQLALATSNHLVDQGVPQQSIQLLPFMPAICTKLGAQGVLLTQLIPAFDERLTSGEYAPYILSRCKNGSEDELGVGGVYVRLFPAVEEVKLEDVVSVNGVGDSFAGALVAGLAKGARVEDVIDVAQRAAVLTLKSGESVSPGLGTLRMLI